MKNDKLLPADCIVLAAGESRRMGRPKQLMKISQVPLVRLVVNIGLAACERVIVVEGAVSLTAALPGDPRVTLVSNPEYKAGQL